MTNGTASDRIIIVGGGYAGLSIAARLAQSGLPVTLLEASQLGFEASTRNQGWLYSGGIFARAHPRLAEMCHAALERTLAFCPECVEPRHEGMDYLFSSDASGVKEWINAWERAGIPAEPVGTLEIVETFPGMDPRQARHAFRLPDRSIRPEVLLSALARQARDAGAEIRTGTPVTKLRKSDGRVEAAVLGTGEAVRGGFFVLAAGTLGWKHLSETTVLSSGGQSAYTRVALKTHLLAVSPSLGRMPFCVPDLGGFNHLPHGQTSVLGANHWTAVRDPGDTTVVPAEVERIWQGIGQLFPGLTTESRTSVRAWAGTTVQAMECDQVHPGAAPLPVLIDHAHDSPHYENLISVHPGRATLWPQLADEVQLHVLSRLGHRATAGVARPAWSQ